MMISIDTKASPWSDSPDPHFAPAKILYHQPVLSIIVILYFVSMIGIALAELWLPVNAEFWFRKATQLSEGKDEEAALLFQKVRVKREYDPLIGDHPITVEFTQFGRAVHAKGELLYLHSKIITWITLIKY